jgi:DNA-binding PadR family transcriptional regulator
MNDLLILATLLDGPKHGYAIKKQAAQMTGRAAMHNNLVYPLLQRFVQKSWLTQREMAGQRGQRRQMYTITAAGRRALVESLSKFGSGEARSAEAFNLRVGFFDLLPAEARAEILARRKAYLEGRAAQLERIKETIEMERWGRETVEFSGRQARAELAWIARLEKLAGHAGRN